MREEASHFSLFSSHHYTWSSPLLALNGRGWTRPCGSGDCAIQMKMNN